MFLVTKRKTKRSIVFPELPSARRLVPCVYSMTILSYETDEEAEATGTILKHVSRQSAYHNTVRIERPGQKFGSVKIKSRIAGFEAPGILFATPGYTPGTIVYVFRSLHYYVYMGLFSSLGYSHEFVNIKPQNYYVTQ